jgi:hypothetical protein
LHDLPNFGLTCSPAHRLLFRSNDAKLGTAMSGMEVDSVIFSITLSL